MNGILNWQQAPVWIPDKRVTMCQLCTAAFTVTFRRHHCRACGKVYEKCRLINQLKNRIHLYYFILYKVICRNCSSHKAELEYLKFRSARVCDDCFTAIRGQLMQLFLITQFY